MPIPSITINTSNGKNGFYQAISQAVSQDSANYYSADAIKEKAIAELQKYYDSLPSADAENFIKKLKAELDLAVKDIKKEINILKGKTAGGTVTLSPADARLLDDLERQQASLSSIPASLPVQVVISKYQQMIRMNRPKAQITEMKLTQEAMNINIMLVNNIKYPDISGIPNIALNEPTLFLHPGVDGSAKPGRPNIYYQNDADFTAPHLLLEQRILLTGGSKFQKTYILKQIATANAAAVSRIHPNDLLSVSDAVPGIPNNINEYSITAARAEVLLTLLSLPVNKSTYTNFTAPPTTTPVDNISIRLYKKLTDDYSTTHPWLHALKEQQALADSAKDPGLLKEQDDLNAALLKALSRKILLDSEAAINTAIKNFLTTLYGSTEETQKKLIIQANSNFQAIHDAIYAKLSEPVNYPVDPTILKQFIQEKTALIQEELQKIELEFLYDRISAKVGTDVDELIFLSDKTVLELDIKDIYKDAGFPSTHSIPYSKMQAILKGIKEKAANTFTGDKDATLRAKFEAQLDALNLSSADLVKSYDGLLKNFRKEHILEIDEATIATCRKELFLNKLFDSTKLQEFLSALTRKELIEFSGIINEPTTTNTEKNKHIIRFFSKTLDASEETLSFIKNINDPAYYTSISTACQNIIVGKSKMACYFETLPAEIVEKIAQANSLEEYVQLLRSNIPDTKFSYHDGPTVVNVELNSTNKQNWVETELLIRSETKKMGITFTNFTLKPDSFPSLTVRTSFSVPLPPVTIEIAREEAANALSRIRERNLTLDAFIPYAYDNTHLLNEALVKRSKISPPLKSIYHSDYDAQWEELSNARTVEEIRKPLEEMGIIEKPGIIPGYRAPSSDLVDKILARRQELTVYNAIHNPALAMVFKRFHPNIILNTDQIDKLNNFLEAHTELNLETDSAGRTLFQRDKLLREIGLEEKPGASALDRQYRIDLSTHLKNASGEIAYHHRNYIRSISDTPEQSILRERIKNDIASARQKLELSYNEEEKSKRFTKLKENETYDTIEANRANTNKPERVAYDQALIMQRMYDFIRPKAYAPNDLDYDISAITEEWLSITNQADESKALQDFNQYMRDTYGIHENESFMTSNDFNIIKNGYTLETALLEGNLEKHVEFLKKNMNKKLSSYKNGKLFGKVFEELQWDEALSETKKLYNNKKIKGVDNFDTVLTQWRKATVLGGGEEAYNFAAKNEATIRQHQQHFERLIQMMETERDVIDALTQERDKCKKNHWVQINTPGNKKAFDELSTDIDIRNGRAKNHRAMYDTYKKWSQQLNEIRFNIDQTLHDGKGNYRQKDETLVVERVYDLTVSIKENTFQKTDWQQFVRKNNPIATTSTTLSTGTLYTAGSGGTHRNEKEYVTDIAQDEVRVKVLKAEDTDKGGIGSIREYDENGNCRVTGEWISRITKASYTKPAAPPIAGATPVPPTTEILDLTSTTPPITRYSKENKRHEINIAARPEDTPNWVKLDVEYEEKFSPDDPVKGEKHKAVLAQQAFNSITEIIIKGYLDKKGYMPNANDPIIITAYDPYAAEYLHAACEFYKMMFPDLLTSKSFKFEGIPPKNSNIPKMMTNNGLLARKNSFTPNPAMKKFLDYLSFIDPSTTLVADKFQKGSSKILKNAVHDCQEAIERMNNRKEVINSQHTASTTGPKSKKSNNALTEGKSTALWKKPFESVDPIKGKDEILQPSRSGGARYGGS
jgi:hypothetical protein